MPKIVLSSRLRRALLVASVLLAVAVPALASPQIFLKTTPDTPGGVLSKAFEGQINANSFSVGYNKPIDPATGMPSGKLVLIPLVVTKSLDEATPLLMKAGGDGKTFTELRLTMTALTSTEPPSVLIIQNAIISDWRLVDARGTSRPTEQITFQVQSYTLNYTPPNNPDGSPGKLVTGSVGAPVTK